MERERLHPVVTPPDAPGEPWDAVRAAFSQTAAWFVGTTGAARDRWEEPGLGEWTVRDLVGHTSRALLTVEAYLDQPVSAVEVNSAVTYFRRALTRIGDPAAVAQRGRDAGAMLGADPADAVAHIAVRVLARVDSAGPHALVATPVGGMRLVDYLPTRTFELTVHTCDLAAALGRALDVPEDAAVHSLHLLGELATQTEKAGALLRAATGRGPLPTGFTVL